jgi:hypothetical protein
MPAALNPMRSTGWRSEVLFLLALGLRLVAVFLPEHAEGLQDASEMCLAAGGAALAVRVKERT